MDFEDGIGLRLYRKVVVVVVGEDGHCRLFYRSMEGCKLVEELLDLSTC